MAGIAEALLGHKRVGFDTPIFIYHLEDVPRYADLTAMALRQVFDGHLRGFTSAMTLLEIAVEPLQLGRDDIADHYVDIIDGFPNLTVIELERAVLRRAALLQATHRVRSPDALQIAACLHAGATAFVTNDTRLRRVTDLSVIVLDDYVDGAVASNVDH